jgi:predicted acetyltransferase
VLELDGEPAGYALYRIHTKFEEGASAGHVDVIEAIADGPLATRELWRVLLDMDWLATLKAFLLPIDHPLLHQLLYPRRLQMRIGDGLWVRLVDVGAALSGRSYVGDGSIVLEVHDAVCPWNEGRWKLEGGAAARTEEAAELELDVAALGSAYLGAVPFAQLRDALRLEEKVEGAVARADALFGWRPLPWCPEIF